MANFRRTQQEWVDILISRAKTLGWAAPLQRADTWADEVRGGVQANLGAWWYGDRCKQGELLSDEHREQLATVGVFSASEERSRSAALARVLPARRERVAYLVRLADVETLDAVPGIKFPEAPSRAEVEHLIREWQGIRYR
ncbi:hypothetical protein [Tsukamurella paurometabola]|uniref:Uncharacterized protein n=1 Tax=Tsukamurella paurometabola TaxID=2061 RepID=A0ABS5NEN2_TSUPA|nr:hypothetical protein [Tsukamurella paurometabola]MBS4102749.1 hypothetical protein [Tsukamurella paurometabola]